MKKLLAKMFAVCMVVSFGIGMAGVDAAFAGESAALAESKSDARDLKAEDLKNPITEDWTYPITTWDTVYFGCYPQTEVTELTEEILEATYDSKGEAVVNNEKYRRIREEDVASSHQETDYYDWSVGGDIEGYHYFKYEPIKWKVLEIDNGKTLLLADENLDTRAFHLESGDMSWQRATLRSWLNGYTPDENSCNIDYQDDNFLDTAFSEEEQGYIQSTILQNDENIFWGISAGEDTVDKIFLLTIEDIINRNYGFRYEEDEYTFKYYRFTRMCGVSDYAKAMGAFCFTGEDYTRYEGGDSEWWLRSAGRTEQDVTTSLNGIMYGQNALTRTDVGVRPAIYVDLSNSDVWNYAGTVNSLGEVKTAETIYEENRIQYIKARKSVVTYEEGEVFNTDDISVTAVRGDESTINVTNDAVIDTSQVNMQVPGIYTVTIRYEDKETTLTITVKKSTKIQIPDGTPEPKQIETDASTGIPSRIFLYVLDDCWLSYLSLPDNFQSDYQLNFGSVNVSYTIQSGDSVTVDQNGWISPVVTTWYSHNGVLTSWSDGSADEKIIREHECGETTICVRKGDVEYTITVEVVDYAEYYAQYIMQEYIEKYISLSMTDLEKLEMICKFVSAHDYSVNHAGYTGLIVAEGGDCWASCSTIIYMCDLLGLKARVRYAANDPGAGSGHRNVVVEIGDEIYIAEAGIVGTAPRPFTIEKKEYGWSYRVLNDGTVCLTQYDGTDGNVTIPAEIDGKVVSTIGNRAFYYSKTKVESITIPDTVTTLENNALDSCIDISAIYIPKSVKKIGDFAFSECDNLKEIVVDPLNQYFTSEDGVLFDKKKERLVSYPGGKGGTYFIPSTVNTIGLYAFSYMNAVEYVYIPESVTSIEEGAFGDCSNLKGVYFYGNAPEFADFIFYNVRTGVYYPKNNDSWTEDVRQNYNGTIEWKTYMEDDLLIDTIKEQKYTGNLIEPEITVRNRGVVLQKDIDYTVSYTDNQNAGTAFVTVTGIGNYSGTYQEAFQIIQKKIEGMNVEFQEGSGYIKIGTEYKPCVIMMDGNKVLKEGVDYKLTYKKIASTIVDVEIVGQGNYSGTISKRQYITYERDDEDDYWYDDFDEDMDEFPNNTAGKRTKVTKLEIKCISKQIAAGKKVALTANVSPQNATNQMIKWSSSNTDYATVNSKGVVTTKKSGAGKTVTITAEATDGSDAEATIELKLMQDTVTKIVIINAKKTLKAGKTMQLKATVKTNGKNANKKLKWTTSNSKYATVNSKGKVTAKKAGKGKTVTITAMSTDGTNKKAKVKVKIK